MNSVKVPVTAVIVLGIVTIVCVYLTSDAEIGKMGITSIGSMVSGGVVGYALRAKQDKKGNGTPKP